jgi:thiol-disulfide isomerase/thioredoxin
LRIAPYPLSTSARSNVVLLAACAGASALPTADPPATDDLSGLIGQAARLEARAIFNSEPIALEDLRGKVVLVRWFLAPICPFCSATAPALNRFDEEYRGRGLIVIGMYHHKDPEPLDLETVRGYVEYYRFRFPVAVDPDWQTLKRWWLDGHERSWTSVSFLIDRRGVSVMCIWAGS